MVTASNCHSQVTYSEKTDTTYLQFQQFPHHFQKYCFPVRYSMHAATAHCSSKEGCSYFISIVLAISVSITVIHVGGSLLSLLNSHGTHIIVGSQFSGNHTLSNC